MIQSSNLLSILKTHKNGDTINIQLGLLDQGRATYFTRMPHKAINVPPEGQIYFNSANFLGPLLVLTTPRHVFYRALTKSLKNLNFFLQK
jgi:hypothetical protein